MSAIAENLFGDIPEFVYAWLYEDPEKPGAYEWGKIETENAIIRFFGVPEGKSIEGIEKVPPYDATSRSEYGHN